TELRERIILKLPPAVVCTIETCPFLHSLPPTLPTTSLNRSPFGSPTPLKRSGTRPWSTGPCACFLVTLRPAPTPIPTYHYGAAWTRANHIWAVSGPARHCCTHGTTKRPARSKVP